MKDHLGHDITTNVSRMVTSQVILILQSCPHEDICLVKDTTNSILHHAPLIPAGMNPFHWNPQEWTGIHRNGQESTGMDRNGTGMALEWTKMDILELKPQ